MDYIATKHGMSEVLNSLVGGTSDPYTVSHIPHSHSIVSSAREHFKTPNSVSGRANFTVRSTVKKCCLGAIEDD